MRFGSIVFAVVLTLAAAYVLYAQSVETRRQAHYLVKLEKQHKLLAEEIAVLRAERAFLVRPKRIEAAARQLGMRPARRSDYLNIDQLNAPPPSASSALRPNRR